MPQPEWEDLERRIAHLERYLGTAAGAIPNRSDFRAASERTTLVSPEVSSALLPVLGRALLGLAGAYLLRALTESVVVAPRAGVAAGILYAILWLIWAARTPSTGKIEAAIHSLTAVVVLAPLLWEATLHFRVISTWDAGALLLFFTLFGLAVSWRKNLLVVATIATLAGLGTAGALLLATHDVLPFTLVFLAIAAAVEASACLEHWLSERWVAAVAANLAVLLATWLVTNERGLPEGYAPIPYGWLLAAQVALLGIYLSSTIIRTLLRGFTFTGFETAQCALAFVIGVGGGLRLSNQAHAVAAFALICAAACYLVAFVLLDRVGARGRNFYTYSTFGIVLALAGIHILFSGATAVILWSVLAIGCIWTGGLFARLTLQVHGGIYLLLALAGSGAMQQATALLLGSAAWPGEHAVAGGAALAVAAICYWLAVRDGHYEAKWNSAAFRLVMAAALVWLAAGTLAGGLTGVYHAALGESASHAYCATLRTGVLAGAALLLAWAGARWSSLELSRLIYPAMLLGAYRLLLVDLHQQRKAALFLSLLVYGGALMLLPRLLRSRSSDAGSPAVSR